jgi:hypothetical protein
MAKTPKELKILEDQITLFEIAARSLAMLTGDSISDRGIEMDNLKRLIRQKVNIDNTLYANDKSDSLDKIQEKAYSLKKELVKFKNELEMDFTEKVKSIKDPGGRFMNKSASIKNVIKNHLSDELDI